MGVVGASARGAIAFAPAVAVEADGTLRYALGNGVLRLATIDRPTLVTRQLSVDVDRRTGFAPSIALNRDGAPAIAWKDDFGPGDRAPAARDGLAFFSLDAGNIVPNLDPMLDRRLPLAPSHTVRSLSTFGFAPYRPLNCESLLTPDDFSRELIVELAIFIALGLDPEMLVQGIIEDLISRKQPEELLESIVRHRRMHVESAAGGRRIVWGFHWQYFRSHPELNAMIDAMPVRPRILQFTVDNSQNVKEEIERIDIAFIEPLVTVDGRHGASLDAADRALEDPAEFPADLRDELGARGIRMGALADVRVQRILASGEQRSDPGRAWIVTDPDPFGARMLWFPHIEDPAEEDQRVTVSVRYRIRPRTTGIRLARNYSALVEQRVVDLKGCGSDEASQAVALGVPDRGDKHDSAAVHVDACGLHDPLHPIKPPGRSSGEVNRGPAIVYRQLVAASSNANHHRLGRAVGLAGLDGL
jgi:hypothetical protein